MVKKYIWIFAVSIVVFLACTYVVTRKVEVSSNPEIVLSEKSHRPLGERPPGRPQPEVERRPAPNSSPPAATSTASSAVAIIQALSGLIAAISGLLGAIAAFRRKTAPA